MPSAPNNPAFNATTGPNGGIEVREYYAAAALAGLLANERIITLRIARQTHRRMLAAVAFLLADEMIAASSLPIPTLNANVDAADLERNA